MKVDFRSKASTLQRFAVTLGGMAVRRRVLVLLSIALITAGLTPFAFQLAYDDDVIQFLPEGDEEVERFRSIGERFHGLNIGIIGVEVPDGDIFEGQNLALIRTLSREIPVRIPGVSFATSIDTVQDVVESETPDGEKVSEVTQLIPEILPRSDEERGALRQRVLSRDHIRGALVSESGDAAIVLCNIAPNASVQETAEAIQALADELEEGLGSGATLHFGGAPFIGAYVANGTRKDLNRLSPFVCAAVILIILLTARSLVGTIIALTSVGIGIAWIMGLMGLANQPLTLVSSSLPVILVALGSAYSIHLLTRILANLDGGETDRDEAVRAAVSEVGPPIFVAGLTTALAFLSFFVMDIRPMRIFGLWMASGTLVIVIQALLFVPAACSLLPLKARGGDRAPRWATGALIGGARALVRHPRISGAAMVIILGVSGYYTAQVGTHMETRAFFEEESEPVLAEDFLEEKLGGSLFLQVEISGDISDPQVLRQIERFADAAAVQSGVTGVQSIALPVRLALLGATGEKRIPWSNKRSKAIKELTQGEKDLVLLVDPNWEHTLVHIKLGGFDTARAEEMAQALGVLGESLFAERAAVSRENLGKEGRAAEVKEVAVHLHHILQRVGQDVSAETLEKTLLERLEDIALTATAIQADVKAELASLLGDPDDSYLVLREGADWKTLVEPISNALVAGSLTVASLAALLTPLAHETEEDATSISESAESVLEYVGEVFQRRKEQAMARALDGLIEEGAASQEELVRAVGVLMDPVAFVPLSAVGSDQVSNRSAMGFEVSGYPMVYTGMNESVHRNQTFSMLVSCGLVLLALTWFFRSFWLALVTAIPAGMTLLFTFGVMGWKGIPMDVGTSMISSIALGVGIDYAVHLVWRHGVVPPEKSDEALVGSLSETGWGIVINALEVSVGFGLLMLGTIVPMQNFGMLTALAMLVSATASLLLIPMLVRWVGVGWHREE